MNKDLNEPIKPADVGQGPVRVSNIMKDDFGLDIPTEAVPLPSRGIIYPQESGFYSKETLDIKPMTAREEDILTSRAFGTVLTELMKSCLIDKSINPDELISGDRNAILISLRITGYGADYSLEIDCPECGARNKQTFDLSQLKIKRLEVEPVSPGQNLFEVVLPVTKKNVKVRFLTGIDEKEMLIIEQRRKKSGFETTSTVTDRLSRSIVSIDGIKDKNKINAFVRNIPVRDSLALRKFLDTHEPGIEMKSWMTCTSCHEESEVKIRMGVTVFWPDTE